MPGNAPTLGQLKKLNVHLLEGLPADPAGLAGSAWRQHLDDGTRSHEAMMALLLLPPAEAIRRLRTIPIFTPFTTIEIGGFKTVEDLCQAVRASGSNILNYAADLMNQLGKVGEDGKFWLTPEPAKLDLYRITNAELGFPNRCTVVQSFAALEKIGAVKLPPEAGAQYRLQYTDQPPGEWRLRLMYMEPITVSYGGPKVFGVECGGGRRWLSSRCAGPECFYDGDTVWVFGRKSEK